MGLNFLVVQRKRKRKNKKGLLVCFGKFQFLEFLLAMFERLFYALGGLR